MQVVERNCEVHSKIELLKQDRAKLWDTRAKLEDEKNTLMLKAAQVAGDVRITSFPVFFVPLQALSALSTAPGEPRAAPTVRLACLVRLRIMPGRLPILPGRNGCFLLYRSRSAKLCCSVATS